MSLHIGVREVYSIISTWVHEEPVLRIDESLRSRSAEVASFVLIAYSLCSRQLHGCQAFSYEEGSGTAETALEVEKSSEDG